MDTQNFERLLASVKEAKEIMNWQKEPSRKFFIKEPSPIERRKKFMWENIVNNKHIGSDFSEFLKEEGIYEETK